MPLYRVKRLNRVNHGRVVGTDKDGKNVVESKVHHPGETLELTEAEADAILHAVERADLPSRDENPFKPNDPVTVNRNASRKLKEFQQQAERDDDDPIDPRDRRIKK